MSTGTGAGRQDALLALDEVSEPSARTVAGAGVDQPVARVLLDSPLPHLDRTFDYLVPPELDVAAAVGTRVTVRFGGQEEHGWVWERGATTTHAGRLAPLRRVVSDLPVLTPATTRLVEAVARRHAGNRADVLRLAVPARHASTEASERDKGPDRLPVLPTWGAPGAGNGSTPSAWAVYDGAARFLADLAAGGSPRAVWTALPERTGVSRPWTACLGEAARAALSGGRGVLVVVATARQAEAVAARLEEELPGEPVVRLTAEQGPARRYRGFLRLLLGHARVVVGTRAAAYAPVPDLGLAVVWDDGDDRLDERRAPYAHARQVLALRSALEGAGLLVGGHVRSVEAQALTTQGWAVSLTAPRTTVRAATPRVEVPGEAELAAEGASGTARIPSLAHRAVTKALREGPVLVQVPRAGYVPVVACARCRTAARCRFCHGPLALDRGGRATCRWCARPAADFRCVRCGGTALRMVGVGSVRTGEELGRAFSGVPVVVSGAREEHGVVETVDGRTRLVVATPGAEPVAEGGYALVLLLDGHVLSARPEMGASAEALRRWTNAAVLAGPGGRVMLLGSPEPVAAQALVRWDHAGFAARELAERGELHLPPAWRTVRLDGPRSAVAAVLAELAGAGGDGRVTGAGGGAPAGRARGDGRATGAGGGAPAGRARGDAGTGRGPGGAAGPDGLGAETLGPVAVQVARGGRPADEQWRGLARVPVERGRDLAVVVRRVVVVRAARREPPVRVELDPTVLW